MKKKITNLLKEHNINFIFNKPYFKDLVTSGGGLGRYDFILLNDTNTPYRLIEFDGIQHFSTQSIFNKTEQSYLVIQANDQIKNNYAIKHNLPLVRIPYYYLNQLTYEDLFSDKFLIKGDGYDYSKF